MISQRPVWLFLCLFLFLFGFSQPYETTTANRPVHIEPLPVPPSAAAFGDSELTQVGSDQRHRVEVGELHVFGQVLGILPQQARQLGRAAARDVVLTLNEGAPKPRGSGAQQHAAGPDEVLKAGRGDKEKQFRRVKENRAFFGWNVKEGE